MKTQCGNALFLILIAVALFAALSYAVTQSGRGGSGIDKEQARLAASELLQYFASIEASIQRLNLIGGYPREEISFSYDAKLTSGIASPNYQANSNCLTPECEVFNPLGGNIPPPIFEKFAPSAASTGYTAGTLHPGHTLTNKGVWTDAGTPLNDISLRVIRIYAEICDEFNDLVDLSSPPVVNAPTQAIPTSDWDIGGASFSIATVSGKNAFGRSTYQTPTGIDVCDIYYKIFDR